MLSHRVNGLFKKHLTCLASVTKSGTTVANASPIRNFSLALQQKELIKKRTKDSADKSSLSGTRRRGLVHSVPLRSSVEALQGEWCDDYGAKIEVNGAEARFGNRKEPCTIDVAGGSLVLGAARLTGTPQAPTWEFPSGQKRHWARPMPQRVADGSDDTHWSQAFLKFKETRLDIQRKLRAAYKDYEFEEISALKSAWEQMSTMPVDADGEQRLVLESGAWIVTGTCFKHTRLNYRGVVLGCEPWCNSPPAWRAKFVPDRPDGEAQPFYYCIVDERDRPGGHTSFVAQADMEPCSLTFPIESPLIEKLLIRSDEIGGYLPNESLETSLRLQMLGGGFSLGF